MPIWAATPVGLVPRIRLQRWTVYELEDGSRHFTGWNATEGEGRVSSAIQSFDSTTCEGVTRSGRIYKLEGAAGVSMDASWTWSQWCAINGIETAKDVSGEYTGSELPLSPTRSSQVSDDNF